MRSEQVVAGLPGEDEKHTKKFNAKNEPQLTVKGWAVLEFDFPAPPEICMCPPVRGGSRMPSADTKHKRPASSSASSGSFFAKVLVTGAKGVGKSSLVQRFVRDEFAAPADAGGGGGGGGAAATTPAPTATTKMLESCEACIDGETVVLQIWDQVRLFGGWSSVVRYICMRAV